MSEWDDGSGTTARCDIAHDRESSSYECQSQLSLRVREGGGERVCSRQQKSEGARYNGAKETESQKLILTYSYVAAMWALAGIRAESNRGDKNSHDDSVRLSDKYCLVAAVGATTEVTSC